MPSVLHQALMWPRNLPTDPYFANVLLLLHMDGTVSTNTPFIDSSSYHRTVTTVGTTGQIYYDNLQVKFGATSAFVNTGYLTVPASNDWIFSGDFTIECWYYAISTGPNQGRPIVDMNINVPLTGSGWSLSLVGSGSFASLGIRVFTATPLTNADSAGNLFSSNAWNHICVQRKTNVVYSYINGVSVTTPYSPLNVNIGVNSAPLYIFNSSDLPGTSFNTQFDELRITGGVARYPIGGFSVPTAAFPDQ
jgi:hypothetical protein